MCHVGTPDPCGMCARDVLISSARRADIGLRVGVQRSLTPVFVCECERSRGGRGGSLHPKSRVGRPGHSISESILSATTHIKSATILGHVKETRIVCESPHRCLDQCRDARHTSAVHRRGPEARKVAPGQASPDPVQVYLQCCKCLSGLPGSTHGLRQIRFWEVSDSSHGIP